MICVKALVRQVEQGDHNRALSRVLGNGRGREQQLQAWLKRHPDELPTVAIGFALMRLAELTYGPTEEGSRLASRLLVMQDECGGFGCGGFAAVSTAVALSGLLFHMDQYMQVGMEPERHLREAVDRAARVLADWIVDQRAAGSTSGELALVRNQMAATDMLAITSSAMLHEASVPDDAMCEMSAAAA